MVQLRLYDTIERQSEMGYEWVFIGSFLTHSNYPPIYLLAPTRLYPTLTRPYQTLIDPNPTLSDPIRPYPPPKIQKPAAFLPRALFLHLINAQAVQVS